MAISRPAPDSPQEEWDTWWAIELASEPIQARTSEFPGFEEQLAAIRNAQMQPRPWRLASVDEALGVPSIFGAVTLIASQMGTLSMEGYRGEARMQPQDRPQIIIRPNPKTTPYAFWFLSAFYKATRGERWWWVAKRDTDGIAQSLFPVPPWEIVVEQNDRDRLNPTIRWLNRIMPNDDMIQDIWFPDSSGLRGAGPLQKSGAAVSVAVESQAWAANFFSGSLPSLVGSTDQDLDEIDLKNLDAQWAEKPGNLPRWMTNGMTLEESPFDAQKAQLSESRQFQVGEVARMFDIPGPLLEYQMSGQSLTYRNEADIWLDFKNRCLGPIFAEPMEQQMSDLLTRSTTARFNYAQLLRADIKTRYEAYQIGVQTGFLSSEEVRREEGMSPGGVDFAPVPFSPPAADPGPIPMTVRTQADGFRCSGCNRKLAESAGAGTIIRCRCGTVNEGVGQEPETMQMRTMALMTALLERPPTIIHNHLPEMRAEPAQVTFEAGAFQVDAPPPAEVNVPVTVQVPEQRPEVSVNVPEVRQSSKRIERDEGGHIIRIVEESA